jgi:hypothetical protein
MRLMFVYYCFGDAGSAQDLWHYSEAAKALGHELVIYGTPDASSSFSFSLDLESVDALIFVFEWTTQLRYGDQLDLARLVGKVSRKRRIVIDCDGAYNDRISVNQDYNHRDDDMSRRWTAVCDSLSDRIFQPTVQPARKNVRPFLFHAYDPAWEEPLDFRAKEFGMVYVGHSKFRWRPMEQILRAIEPVRELIGRIALVGHGWDAQPPWAAPMQIEDIYYTDPLYLKKIGVEFVAPVPFEQVIPWMSRAIFNPVIYRPLFSHLRMVTCRTFETPASSTIPLFGLDEQYVADLYGKSALDLVLPKDHPEKKILDIVRRPDEYAQVVHDIRRYLAFRHSYCARFQELLALVQN